MLWQVAYSEIWYTDVLWPDFREKHIVGALLDYQNRNRRLEDYNFMKTRVISGVIGFCILVAVLLAGKLVLSIAVSIICFIALYEFYKSISKAGYKLVKLPGYLSAFILAFRI